MSLKLAPFGIVTGGAKSSAVAVFVGDVLDEQHEQDVVLVLAGIHAAAQFIAGGPERGVEVGFLDGHGARTDLPQRCFPGWLSSTVGRRLRRCRPWAVQRSQPSFLPPGFSPMCVPPGDRPPDPFEAYAPLRTFPVTAAGSWSPDPGRARTGSNLIAALQYPRSVRPRVVVDASAKVQRPLPNVVHPCPLQTRALPLPVVASGSKHRSHTTIVVLPSRDRRP